MRACPIIVCRDDDNFLKDVFLRRDVTARHVLSEQVYPFDIGLATVDCLKYERRGQPCAFLNWQDSKNLKQRLANTYPFIRQSRFTESFYKQVPAAFCNKAIMSESQPER